MNLITAMQQTIAPDFIEPLIELSPMQGVLVENISQTPWWVYLILSLLPLVTGIIMAIAIVTYWKKINYSAGEPDYTMKRMYWMAFITGFACGCFCQYGLQEMGEVLIKIPPLTMKATLVTGVLVAIFNPMVYDILRNHAKRKQWLGVYRFLTIKKEVVSQYFDDDPDPQTIFVDREDTTERNRNNTER